MAHVELLTSGERVTQARGFTLWLTGLSGAGKSTLATAVGHELRRRGIRVEVLDGDEVRQNLSKGLGFSREDRDTNIRRIGYVAKLLTRTGVGVITAAISPYRAVRDEVRREIGAFVEVYVKASLDECARRDTKGRSEEHTSELQSPFLISYAVFCLKKKKKIKRLIALSSYKHKKINKRLRTQS